MFQRVHLALHMQHQTPTYARTWGSDNMGPLTRDVDWRVQKQIDNITSRKRILGMVPGLRGLSSSHTLCHHPLPKFAPRSGGVALSAETCCSFFARILETLCSLRSQQSVIPSSRTVRCMQGGPRSFPYISMRRTTAKAAMAAAMAAAVAAEFFQFVGGIFMANSSWRGRYMWELQF